MTRRVSPRLSKVWRYALVGSLAFSLGSAATVTAGPTISGFVGLADGDNTAAISASRELSVTDAVARGRLADIGDATSQLTFDREGNLMTAQVGPQTVNGTVDVGNFPATQNVAGSVNVGNFPATQNVAGSVNVGNFPVTQPVSGTVGISSSANTVKIDPLHNGRTTVLLTLFFEPVPSSGVTRVLDVSSYERIRVTVQNHNNPPSIKSVTIHRNDGIGWIVDQYTLVGGEMKDKVYELAGASITIVVTVTAAELATKSEFMSLQVWGR